MYSWSGQLSTELQRGTAHAAVALILTATGALGGVCVIGGPNPMSCVDTLQIEPPQICQHCAPFLAAVGSDTSISQAPNFVWRAALVGGTSIVNGQAEGLDAAEQNAAAAPMELTNEGLYRCQTDDNAMGNPNCIAPIADLEWDGTGWSPCDCNLESGSPSTMLRCQEMTLSEQQAASNANSANPCGAAGATGLYVTPTSVWSELIESYVAQDPELYNDMAYCEVTIANYVEANVADYESDWLEQLAPNQLDSYWVNAIDCLGSYWSSFYFISWGSGMSDSERRKCLNFVLGFVADQCTDIVDIEQCDQQTCAALGYGYLEASNDYAGDLDLSDDFIMTFFDWQFWLALEPTQPAITGCILSDTSSPEECEDYGYGTIWVENLEAGSPCTFNHECSDGMYCSVTSITWSPTPADSLVEASPGCRSCSADMDRNNFFNFSPRGGPADAGKTFTAALLDCADVPSLADPTLSQFQSMTHGYGAAAFGAASPRADFANGVQGPSAWGSYTTQQYQSSTIDPALLEWTVGSTTEDGSLASVSLSSPYASLPGGSWHKQPQPAWWSYASLGSMPDAESIERESWWFHEAGCALIHLRPGVYTPSNWNWHPDASPDTMRIYVARPEGVTLNPLSGTSETNPSPAWDLMATPAATECIANLMVAVGGGPVGPVDETEPWAVSVAARQFGAGILDACGCPYPQGWCADADPPGCGDGCSSPDVCPDPDAQPSVVYFILGLPTSEDNWCADPDWSNCDNGDYGGAAGEVFGTWEGNVDLSCVDGLYELPNSYCNSDATTTFPFCFELVPTIALLNHPLLMSSNPHGAIEWLEESSSAETGMLTAIRNIESFDPDIPTGVWTRQQPQYENWEQLNLFTTLAHFYGSTLWLHEDQCAILTFTAEGYAIHVAYDLPSIWAPFVEDPSVCVVEEHQLGPSYSSAYSYGSDGDRDAVNPTLADFNSATRDNSATSSAESGYPLPIVAADWASAGLSSDGTLTAISNNQDMVMGGVFGLQVPGLSPAPAGTVWTKTSQTAASSTWVHEGGGLRLVTFSWGYWITASWQHVEIHYLNGDVDDSSAQADSADLEDIDNNEWLGLGGCSIDGIHLDNANPTSEQLSRPCGYAGFDVEGIGLLGGSSPPGHRGDLLRAHGLGEQSAALVTWEAESFDSGGSLTAIRSGTSSIQTAVPALSTLPDGVWTKQLVPPSLLTTDPGLCDWECQSGYCGCTPTSSWIHSSGAAVILFWDDDQEEYYIFWLGDFSGLTPQSTTTTATSSTVAVAASAEVAGAVSPTEFRAAVAAQLISGGTQGAEVVVKEYTMKVRSTIEVPAGSLSASDEAKVVALRNSIAQQYSDMTGDTVEPSAVEVSAGGNRRRLQGNTTQEITYTVTADQDISASTSGALPANIIVAVFDAANIPVTASDVSTSEPAISTLIEYEVQVTVAGDNVGSSAISGIQTSLSDDASLISALAAETGDDDISVSISITSVDISTPPETTPELNDSSAGTSEAYFSDTAKIAIVSICFIAVAVAAAIAIYRHMPSTSGKNADVATGTGNGPDNLADNNDPRPVAARRVRFNDGLDTAAPTTDGRDRDIATQALDSSIESHSNRPVGFQASTTTRPVGVQASTTTRRANPLGSQQIDIFNSCTRTSGDGCSHLVSPVLGLW